MRQGQQHRRGRSRGGQGNHGQHNNNNQNRKGQNPLSRSYQSNGPDGKVSGTAQSIAEKYLSLARDALSSGDPVLAENYLQHAEHYNRIILAYREQLQQSPPDDGGQGRVRPQGQAGGPDQLEDGADEESGEPYGRDFQPLPPMEQRPRQNEPQPRMFDQPRDGNRDGNRQDGGRFDDRQPRTNEGQQRQPRDRFQPRDRYNGDRSHGGRNDRFGFDRGDRQPNGDRQLNGERPPRESGFTERPRVSDAPPPSEGFTPAPRADTQPSEDVGEARQPQPRPARRERPAPAVASEHEQPEFLRRPVRRPRREASPEESPPPAPNPEPEASEG